MMAESMTEHMTEAQKSALEKIRKNSTEENLWECVVAFQEYPFFTASGLPFTYRLKIGKHGTYNRELLVDRREKSKSLSWSSIVLAFRKSREMEVVSRPKAIGDIRGISYIYSLLWNFGVIQVPEKVESSLRGTDIRMVSSASQKTCR